MTEAFDPYHRWLGISPKDQPPNHYRLLGIDLFESNPDVIEAAADRQMTHVRTYQAGKHSQLSQKLLNEISAARVYNGLEKLGASIRWIRDWSDKGCRRRIHGEETTGIYGSLPRKSRLGGNSWGGDAGRIGEPV